MDGATHRQRWLLSFLITWLWHTCTHTHISWFYGGHIIVYRYIQICGKTSGGGVCDWLLGAHQHGVVEEFMYRMVEFSKKNCCQLLGYTCWSDIMRGRYQVVEVPVKQHLLFWDLFPIPDVLGGSNIFVGRICWGSHLLLHIFCTLAVVFQWYFSFSYAQRDILLLHRSA